MDHFIPLVKVLKSKGNMYWSDVIDWYAEYYLTRAKEFPHQPAYARAIAEILTNYMDTLTLKGGDRKLVPMKEMVKRLNPSEAWQVKFRDLNLDATDNYDIRVIGVCCSILLNCIPASVWGEDYHKE